MPAVTTSSPITAARPAARRTSCARTSGQVWPAAGFVEAAGRNGRAHTIELNLEPSAVGTLFAEHRPGLASETVPRLVERLLDSHA